MNKVRRSRVVLGVKANNKPALLDKGYAVYNGVSAHPEVFVTPNPPLPLLKGRLVAFHEAQQAVGTGTKGAAAVRDNKAFELITILETGRGYVQELCDASPEQAAVIAKAAAMRIGEPQKHNKPLLQAKQRQAGSAVQIVANVGVLTEATKGRVFFNWQVSADGGATWINAPSTPRGRTEIAGLTALVTYAFRVSVTDAKSTGAWSDAVTFLVR